MGSLEYIKFANNSLLLKKQNSFCISLITKVTLGISTSKEIRTAKYRFYSPLDLHNAPIHPILLSNQVFA
jgi:hypothetical protein